MRERRQIARNRSVISTRRRPITCDRYCGELPATMATDEPARGHATLELARNSFKSGAIPIVPGRHAAWSLLWQCSGGTP